MIISHNTCIDSFLQISDIESFLVPIFERVNLLNAETGGPAGDGGAVLENALTLIMKTQQSQTAVDMGKDRVDGEKVAESRVKQMRRRQRAKLRFSKNSRERTKRLMFYMFRLSIIVVLYIVYFSSVSFFFGSELKARRSLAHQITDAQKQQILTRKSFFALREYQMQRIESLLGSRSKDISNFTAAAVRKMVDDLETAREHVLFGNKVRHKVEMKETVF